MRRSSRSILCRRTRRGRSGSITEYRGRQRRSHAHDQEQDQTARSTARAGYCSNIQRIGPCGGRTPSGPPCRSTAPASILYWSVPRSGNRKTAWGCGASVAHQRQRCGGQRADGSRARYSAHPQRKCAGSPTISTSKGAMPARSWQRGGPLGLRQPHGTIRWMPEQFGAVRSCCRCDRRSLPRNSRMNLRVRNPGLS